MLECGSEELISNQTVLTCNEKVSTFTKGNMSGRVKKNSRREISAEEEPNLPEKKKNAGHFLNSCHKYD
jgi:hypothetical protein